MNKINWRMIAFVVLSCATIGYMVCAVIFLHIRVGMIPLLGYRHVVYPVWCCCIGVLLLVAMVVTVHGEIVPRTQTGGEG